MEKIVVRPATTADLPVLYRFEQGVIAAERPFDVTIRPEPIHYYDLPFMLSAPHIHLVVAVLDDQVVGSGYARIEPARHYLKHTHHAYLGFMFVDPPFRGRGINQLVLEGLKKWVQEQGLTEMDLDVYVGNEPAIRAYEKMGLKPFLLNMRLGLAD